MPGKLPIKPGLRYRRRQLVIACPTYSAAQLFRDFDPELSAAFDSFPYAPIIVVATGHRREDVKHPLDGFGFLIPRTQGLRTLGSIWTSSIFRSAPPKDLFSSAPCWAGPAIPPSWNCPMTQLWQTLRTRTGSADRHARGSVHLCAFIDGSAEFRSLNSATGSGARGSSSWYPGIPGFTSAGNAYYGVGLNDCVKMAYKVADQLRA